MLRTGTASRPDAGASQMSRWLQSASQRNKSAHIQARRAKHIETQTHGSAQVKSIHGSIKISYPSLHLVATRQQTDLHAVPQPQLLEHLLEQSEINGARMIKVELVRERKCDLLLVVVAVERVLREDQHVWDVV